MALISARYACALAEAVAEAKIKPEPAAELLTAFNAELQASAELNEAMQSPAIRMDEKLAVLDAVLAKLVGKQKESLVLVRNFIAVLTEHGRVGFLPEVLTEYQRIEDERNGVAVVEITSAQELPTAERKLLEVQIGKMAGVTVRAQYANDKSLLGGVVVRLGSTIYDGSVKGRLDRLKQELLRG